MDTGKGQASVGDGLLDTLADILSNQPQNMVLGLNVKPLLVKVEELFAENMGSVKMSETAIHIGQVIEQLDSLVTKWLVANGKNPETIGKWVVYARCVEYLGFIIGDLVKDYQKTAVGYKPTDEKV